MIVPKSRSGQIWFIIAVLAVWVMAFRAAETIMTFWNGRPFFRS